MIQIKNWILGGLLVIVLTATASADFKKGEDAFLFGDYATALAEWRPLAIAGNANAQHNIAVMYDEGLGVVENDTEALRWYRRAAEKKYTPAQVNLGLMYAEGKGITQDYRPAYMWFDLAAKLGDRVARTNRNKIKEFMTIDQITKAKEMSRQCRARNYKGC